MALRLVTWNVQHARPTAGGDPDPEALAAACAGLDADVLALQELDRSTSRVHGADLLAAVAAATGLVAVDGPVHPLLGGTYGNAVLVRGAVVGPPVVAHLPRPARRLSWPLRHRPPLRGLVAAVVEPDRWAAGPLVVAAAHLGVRPGEAAPQLAAALGVVADLAAGRPAVLLLDANLRPPAVAGVVAGAPGWATIDVPVAFPAPAPTAAIDHVVVRDLAPGARPGPATAHALGVSDHRAVVVVLDGC